MRRILPVLFMLMTACHASPGNHYYILSPVPATHVSGLAAPRVPVTIHKLSLPAVTDRPQIVLRSGPNEIHILEYHRWAEPFDNMVRRVLEEDLNTVIAAGSANTKRVDVTLEEFSGDAQGNVILKAAWSVKPSKGRSVTSAIHHFNKTETGSAGMDAMAAVMSRLLGELASAIRDSLK